MVESFTLAVSPANTPFNETLLELIVAVVVPSYILLSAVIPELTVTVAAVMLAAYNYLSPKQTEYGVGVPNAIAGVSNYTVNLTK